jgi:hypothetical protein
MCFGADDFQKATPAAKKEGNGNQCRAFVVALGASPKKMGRGGGERKMVRIKSLAISLYRMSSIHRHRHHHHPASASLGCSRFARVHICVLHIRLSSTTKHIVRARGVV